MISAADHHSRDELPAAILEREPVKSFQLEELKFATNLRKSRRVEQPQVHQARRPKRHSLFSRWENSCHKVIVHRVSMTPSAWGWITALQKPSGVVVGSIVRRLVARTMARQLSTAVETATAPEK